MGESSIEPTPMEVECGSEKIDMSLDDLIKINRKEHKATNSVLNRKAQQARKRNISAGKQQHWFRQRTQNQQGLGFKRNVAQQGYNTRQSRSIRRGPSTRKAAGPSKGIASVNYQAKKKGDFPNSVTISNNDQLGAQRRQPRIQGRFRQTPRAAQVTARRIPAQNKRLQQRQQMQRQQRVTRMNFNRGLPPLQTKIKTGQRKERTRRWQQQPGSGSILTVSVSNPRAGQQKLLMSP
ncbi:UAP56-interacting factor isoform X2 [Latimeria chalumnae]|uniref:UAP56-interacting factor isoform X2 n=1 Tax=Latimeria chalumnae TaxID=7897 RepID=UPI0003C12162|nr:PREDICTED: UAP56-interacting factor-like isoform X2 [Latimeria chalumnae]|eukprot:XP_006008765.1 PREDICTED: UAP56-interacting factor-like isoform X2 [Latimeria chalumnae]